MRVLVLLSFLIGSRFVASAELPEAPLPLRLMLADQFNPQETEGLKQLANLVQNLSPKQRDSVPNLVRDTLQNSQPSLRRLRTYLKQLRTLLRQNRVDYFMVTDHFGPRAAVANGNPAQLLRAAFDPYATELRNLRPEIEELILLTGVLPYFLNAEPEVVAGKSLVHVDTTEILKAYKEALNLEFKSFNELLRRIPNRGLKREFVNKRIDLLNSLPRTVSEKLADNRYLAARVRDVGAAEAVGMALTEWLFSVEEAQIALDQASRLLILYLSPMSGQTGLFLATNPIEYRLVHNLIHLQTCEHFLE